MKTIFSDKSSGKGWLNQKIYSQYFVIKLDKIGYIFGYKLLNYE